MALSFRRAKKLVCVLVLGVMGYLDYASCYIVGHNEVYNHHLKPAAIVLWVLNGITQFSVCLYWAIIYTRGPGNLPKITPLNIYGTDPSLLPVPDVFECDEYGFPFWCSHCQSLKQRRLFHLGDLQYCVPKFDHYCLWVGTGIGRDNLLVFVKFLLSCLGYLVVILCYTAYTTKAAFARSPDYISHYIVLYVFCVFWFLMISSLFCITTHNMSKNRTTLDDINTKNARVYARYEARLRRKTSSFLMGKVPRKELGIRYVNVAHGGSRKVVPYNVLETPYNLGVRNNLINLVYGRNISNKITAETATWKNFGVALCIYIVPYLDLIIRFPSESPNAPDDFSPDFIASITEKINQGNFTNASYLQSKSESDT